MLWQQIYEQSEPGQLKDNAGSTWDSCSPSAPSMPSMASAEFARRGRPPASLEELRRSDSPAPIVDAAGIPFEYNASTGKASLSPRSPIWRRELAKYMDPDLRREGRPLVQPRPRSEPARGAAAAAPRARARTGGLTFAAPLAGRRDRLPGLAARRNLAARGFPEGQEHPRPVLPQQLPGVSPDDPARNDYYSRRPKDLAVYGVMLDREPPGFFDAMPIAFPVLRSPGPALHPMFKLRHVPFLARVAPGGRVDSVSEGITDPIKLGELFRP